MKSIPLSEFVKIHTQAGAGQLLGLSQGAISKMLIKGRVVRVEIEGCGFTAIEEKTISRPPQSQSAA